MHKTRNILMFFLLALIAAGCATTASNVLNVKITSGIASDRVVEENNHRLARSLEFGDVSIKALGAGGAEVQVMIKNTKRKDVSFEYRFIWYDAKGFELSPAPAWMPTKLSGKEERGFRTTTPAPGAVKFKLMVRKPHPVKQ